MILLDANVLLRMTDRNHPHYNPTISAVFKNRKTEPLAIVPQSLYEFCAVATRSPANNGLGMDVQRANRWVTRYLPECSELLPSEPEDLLDRWQALVADYQIKGFQMHDARYVAAMQSHGLTLFMTYKLQTLQELSDNSDLTRLRPELREPLQRRLSTAWPCGVVFSCVQETMSHLPPCLRVNHHDGTGDRFGCVIRRVAREYHAGQIIGNLHHAKLIDYMRGLCRAGHPFEPIVPRLREDSGPIGIAILYNMKVLACWPAWFASHPPVARECI